MGAKCGHEIVALDFQQASDLTDIVPGELFNTKTCCIICGYTTIDTCYKTYDHIAHDLGLAYRPGRAKDARNEFIRKADQYYKEEKSI